jgi:hypothetical protein
VEAGNASPWSATTVFASVTSRTANAIATQMVPASIDVFMIECFLYTCIAVEQLIGPRGIATGDVLAAVVGFASR